MRLITCLLILSSIGCAKSGGEPQASGPCTSYVSPYEVEYPDGSLRKSEVVDCGSSLKATALDSTGDAFEATSIIIQLKDVHTGLTYLTTFDGQ